MFRKYKQESVFIIVIIFAGLLLSLCFEFVINKIFPQAAFHFDPSRLISNVGVLSTTILLIKYRTFFAANLHKAFLLTASVFGIAFILVFPKTVFLSPDDQIHFRRAYIFTHQTINLRGEALLLESVDFKGMGDGGFDELSMMNSKLDEFGRASSGAQYTADNPAELYNTLVFLPFHLGFELSNLLHLDFATSITMAKIFNLVCYVVLIYFAIKLSGKFNKIFFVVGLLLCNIFLATQFSYDSMIIASLLLAISLFLFIRQTKNVSSKYLFTFIVVAALGSLAKAVYCPILLLALMIPSSQFDCKKRAITFKICAMIIMVLILSTFVLPVLSGNMGSDLRGGNTSVGGQISFLVQNPLKAVVITVVYLVGSFPSRLFDAIWAFDSSSGAVPIIARVAVILPLIQVISMVVVFRVIFNTNLTGTTITKRSKLALAGIFMILVGSITAAMYISFTPVGQLKVAGVQSRYFMPFFPLFMIMLAPYKQSQTTEQGDHDFITMFAMYFCLLAVFCAYVLRMSML